MPPESVPDLVRCHAMNACDRAPERSLASLPRPLATTYAANARSSVGEAERERFRSFCILPKVSLLVIGVPFAPRGSKRRRRCSRRITPRVAGPFRRVHRQTCPRGPPHEQRKSRFAECHESALPSVRVPIRPICGWLSGYGSVISTPEVWPGGIFAYATRPPEDVPSRTVSSWERPHNANRPAPSL